MQEQIYQNILDNSSNNQTFLQETLNNPKQGATVRKQLFMLKENSELAQLNQNYFDQNKDDVPKTPININQDSILYKNGSNNQCQNNNNNSSIAQQYKFALTTKQNVNQKGDLGWYLLKKMAYIKSFVNKIRFLGVFSSFSNITQKQLNLINDFSYIDCKSQEKQNKFKQFAEVLHQFVEFIPIISPDNFIMIIWNIILLTVIIFKGFLIPIEISFGIELDNNINIYILAILFTDIILQFFKAFYEEGVIILDKKQIFLNYIKNNFIFDLFSTLSIFILLLAEQNLDIYQIYYIQSVFLIRIFYIPKMAIVLDEYFQLERKFYTAIQLIKLLFLISIVAHYVGCGFHLIAVQEIKYDLNQVTWLHKYSLQDASWGDRYINSIYFSFITMITVGYGDISPNTIIEKIYVIVVTVLACGIFGYALNTIGSIFQEIAQKEQTYRQHY